MRRLVRRSVAAAVALIALISCGLVAAGPAAAEATPIGQNGSTDPMSTVAIILVFVGAPLAALTIAAIFLLPARSVGALRYRPGRPWGYEREWFGTSPDRVVTVDEGELAVSGGSSGSW